MKILMAASEIYPFAKTGGLADVIYSLTNELFGLGHDVKLVLPGYPQILEVFTPHKTGTPEVKLADISNYRIEIGKLKNLRADVFLVKSERVFEDSRKLYGGKKFNEFLRYLSLSHAAAYIAMGKNPINWRAEILHAHDWHAGMAFNCLDGDCSDISRVFSIHNIAFSGCFPNSYWDLVSGVGNELSGFKYSKTQEFSFLEEALLSADKINTVSASYATEIQHKRFGFGFEEILAKRSRDVFGILNGVDYKIWHPEQDPHLPLGHSKFASEEKQFLKSRIQQKYGLSQNPNAVLCSFTNRLTHQKMIDVIIEAIERDSLTGCQFVFHAKGQPEFESALRKLHSKNQNQVAFIEGFQEETEHLLLAGADVCLSPSRFEPCGLNALYAMRYGALPLVRPVGGFLDTVCDEFSTAGNGEGNGFYMKAETADSFVYTMKRIQSLFKNTEHWTQLVENAKRQNFSWRHSANDYVKLYNLATRRRQMIAEIGTQYNQLEVSKTVRLAG